MRLVNPSYSLLAVPESLKPGLHTAPPRAQVESTEVTCDQKWMEWENIMGRVADAFPVNPVSTGTHKTLSLHPKPARPPNEALGSTSSVTALLESAEDTPAVLVSVVNPCPCIAVQETQLFYIGVQTMNSRLISPFRLPL